MREDMKGFIWTLALLLFIQYGLVEGVPQPRDTTIRNCSASPQYIPPTAKISTEDLNKLRQQMREHNITAYIIPATDPHLGEYTANREKRRQWLTGFTGSSGTAAVTLTRAAVFTDSRYWTQAERQMDCNWELQKILSASEIVSWILQELKEGDEIGFDPFLFSIDDWQSFDSLLQDSGRILRSIPNNLVDAVWGSQRPALPDKEIYSIPNEFVGSTWQEKVTDIRKQMEQHPQKPTAVLLSALEESAWLFNLRGADIPNNPFFYSYSLLTTDSIRLFLNVSRITDSIRTYLNTNCPGSTCVQILDYEKVRETVTDYVKGNVKVWIGSRYTNYGVYEVIPKKKLLSETYSPVLMTKAVKTEKEQELLKQCHIRDAVAVVEYLLWLEQNVPKDVVTEISGADYVDGLRAKQAHFKGPSFGTISAGGLNAALPHYRPDNQTNRKLSVKEMYLVDSGGQYYDGTTDITRTVHWGTPTDFEKEAYTRVLMGNIELSRLVFPPRTPGRAIESIARQALWEVGLNFGHGTGHGIGNFFAVHEWPVGLQSNNIGFTKGMFTSIEPGYYHDGYFGIRIEDIAVVVEADTKIYLQDDEMRHFSIFHHKNFRKIQHQYGEVVTHHQGIMAAMYYFRKTWGCTETTMAGGEISSDSGRMYWIQNTFGGEKYLTFETVTLVPYDRNLIDTGLMTDVQIKYVDKHYEKIRKTLGPELQKQNLHEAFKWLEKNTKPLLSHGNFLTASIGILIVTFITNLGLQ